MDIRAVTGIDVIDSNLHFNGFVRIENIRLKTNYFTMRVAQGWNVWHVATTALKWKPFTATRMLYGKIKL